MRESHDESSVSKAAALRYKPGEDEAPVVVAKGKGFIAQRIVAIAKEHEVPIFADEAMAEMLLRLPLDTTIPSELYQAVAEVLSFLYKMKSSRGTKSAKGS